MNRSSDQALRSLLPTHNGDFPPQLADLASSLLAQSRHRASALKADEEIARAYACAHLACDRLKTSLNLPPIEPRPPIQPRLYKRLYAHLSSVLQPAPASRHPDHLPGPSTPRGVRAAQASATPERRSARTPRPTPKSLQTSERKSRNVSGRSRAAGASLDGDATSTYPWLRPTVRYVCSDLGHAQLAPTMAAGLSAILRDSAAVHARSTAGTDNGADGSADWVAENMTSLAAGLYYYCLSSWRARSGGRGGRGKDGQKNHVQSDADSAPDIHKEQYGADEKAILAAFQKARREAVGAEEGTAVWEDAGWRDLTRRSFRDALVVVSKRKWLESDWFQDIQNLRDENEEGRVSGEGDDNDSGGDDDDDDEDGTNRIPTHAWRADSMFQERYDLLAESRRLDYEAWKEDVLRRLGPATTIASGASGGDAMVMD